MDNTWNDPGALARQFAPALTGQTRDSRCGR